MTPYLNLCATRERERDCNADERKPKKTNKQTNKRLCWVAGVCFVLSTFPMASVRHIKTFVSTVDISTMAWHGI